MTCLKLPNPSNLGVFTRSHKMFVLFSAEPIKPKINKQENKQTKTPQPTKQKTTPVIFC